MKEIGTSFEASMVAGLGGSKKLEQKDAGQEEYSFGDALASKETEEDKAEKKEMQYKEIEREESQAEVNKKEYEKFMQRQNMLLSNTVTVNASTQQMANNLPHQTFTNTMSMGKAPAGNQMINQGQVGLKDLQKLMAQRGISFSQLNSQQMAKLTTIHSRVEVNSFLNELTKEIRSDKDKNINFAGPHNMAVDRTEQKREKVTQTGDKKNSGMNDDKEKEVEKLQEASGAADKIKGAPVAEFFQNAGVSEFKQGSAMEQQIIKQILDKMEIDTEKAKSEVAIKLNPEYLGDVRLNMSVDKDKGTVSINFKTTSRTAKKVLEGNLSSLEETFAAAGLKIENFEVALEDDLA